ncbi:MAG: ABC transporter substrate-binding protein [Streptomycetaceae bacterium]|nr:ABC transporter substrate-binding protein [Streptomycetaceae bacterium]
MMSRTRTAAIAATAIALVLGATACGDSLGGKPVKGGTLTIVEKADFDHLDPQRIYTTEADSAIELLARSLTNWDVTGSTPKLVGDLATDTGTPSDNDQVWTFHLRHGVKWQDGSEVTSQDIKYGVERVFSPDISGGPPYASQWLVGGSTYTGPYKGKSLDSLQTPDPYTIVFHLNQPVADFNETTAMPTWAAVPKAHDTGSTYDTHVWSDGPYKLQSYTHNKEAVLVKNPYWNASTDPLREQNVNEVDIKMGMNESAIDQLLESDAGSAKTSMQQWPIAGSNLSTVLGNPALKHRIVSSKAPGILYMAINTTRVKDIRVRQAIEYAINKETVRGAFGGSGYGDYATTMLTPGIGGYKHFNLYSSNPAGDLAKAKQLMAQAGNPKLTLSLSVENTPTHEHFGDAVKNALNQIGITVNVTPVDAGSYFSTVWNVKNQYDLYWEDWIADWPNASTVLPVLFDGRQIAKLPQANQDASYVNDPALEAQMDSLSKMPDLGARNAAYGNLDEEIMRKAAVVPLMYMNFPEMFGSKVGGLYPDAILGEPNLMKVFIKS